MDCNCRSELVIELDSAAIFKVVKQSYSTMESCVKGSLKAIDHKFLGRNKVIKLKLSRLATLYNCPLGRVWSHVSHLVSKRNH